MYAQPCNLALARQLPRNTRNGATSISTKLLLPALKRYEIRCKVLHQGRARSVKRGRYAKFAFGQPDASGRVDHVRPEGDTLHIDVGELYRETREAMRKWIIELESNPSS